MKRHLLALVLVLLLVISLSACGGSSSSSTSSSGNSGKSASVDSNSSSDAEKAPDAGKVSSKDITVDEQIIFDQDGIKVTVTGFTMGEGLFSFGPSLTVLIENDSTQGITIQTRDASINNIMVETIMSSDVAIGKKANTEITFMSSYLDRGGIEQVKDIEFRLHIFDAETWDTIIDSDLIHIRTSVDDSFVQTIDDSGIPALEQDGVRIVVKELDDVDSFWGADIYLFIENNSGQDITVQARDTSINGFMIDPIFSSDVLNGKVAFTELTFFDSDLQDNGIETIETLELSFHIFNTASWDTLFDSDPVTITFS